MFIVLLRFKKIQPKNILKKKWEGNKHSILLFLKKSINAREGKKEGTKEQKGLRPKTHRKQQNGRRTFPWVVLLNVNRLNSWIRIKRQWLAACIKKKIKKVASMSHL